MKNSMETKKDLIFKKVKTFYSIEKNLNSLKEILTNDRKYAKRVIEWFVANYSKEIPVTLKVRNKDFDVYENYKLQLKSFSKDYFDPFRRKEKIKFKGLETTIGQLNFFKWIIENKILGTIKKNYSIIQEHMKKTLEKQKLKKNSKRSSLCSKTVVRTFHKKYENATITFS